VPEPSQVVSMAVGLLALAAALAWRRPRRRAPG